MKYSDAAWPGACFVLVLALVWTVSHGACGCAVKRGLVGLNSHVLASRYRFTMVVVCVFCMEHCNVFVLCRGQAQGATGVVACA